MYNFYMRFGGFIKKSIQHFNSKNSSQIAAALSYYSLFAIAPVLFILFLLLEVFLSDFQTQSAIFIEVNRIFPYEIAVIIRNMIQNIANYEAPGSISGVAGVVILLISSTTVVRELQKALNTMWEVKKPDQITLSHRFAKRILAFIFIVSLGFLLLISFIVNTVLNAVGQYIFIYIGFDPLTLYILNILIALVTVTILFALLFKYLPDISMSWSDVILGAVTTGMLFILGKNIIGYVLGHTDFTSLYGATGTILIFLIWVYYSSLIFLFGASLTYVYAKEFGKGIKKIIG